MDERQTRIVEGAGLEESRVNEELIAFLNKWSLPVLVIVALISGGYFLKNTYEQRRVAKRDEAFAQLGAVEASQTPSVFSLTEIADQFDGVGSVSELARLKAADVHMQAVRTGIDPADGLTELSADDRGYHLEKAEGLYRRVLDSAGSADGRGLIAANAAFGLAAVSETRGESDAAKGYYERAKSIAESSGYQPLADVADSMLNGIGSGVTPELFSKDELPRMPYEPEPVEEPTADEDTTVLPAELPTEESVGPPPGETVEPVDEPAVDPVDDPDGG